MKQAYIIKGFRTAVGKAPKGSLRFTRPDVLAATVIEKLMAAVPQLDKDRIDDLIVGNAMPEAEQGLNVARLISLMGLNTDKVPGVTVNRYCASGSEAIAIASAKIQAGMADCIIAGSGIPVPAAPLSIATFDDGRQIAYVVCFNYSWPPHSLRPTPHSR